jgi:hypothetical protein
MMDRLQLGILQLDLTATQGIPAPAAAAATNPRWFRITPDIIDSPLWRYSTTSEDTIDLLSDLITDPGIGFEAQYRISSPHLLVRCSLLPSDGRGGDWQLRPQKDRGETLKRLFSDLRDGWDEGGDRLLAERVRLLREKG